MNLDITLGYASNINFNIRPSGGKASPETKTKITVKMPNMKVI